MFNFDLRNESSKRLAHRFRDVSLVIILLLCTSCQPPIITVGPASNTTVAPNPSLNAYANLRAAYLRKDAALAAQSYAENAELIYAYTGDPVERYQGRAAITQSFQSFFDRFENEQNLDLNFRLLPSSTPPNQQGVYRLRVGKTLESYGRFDVSMAPNDPHRFQTDRSTEADIADFENLAGAVMLAPDDETLSKDFYGKFLGRYLKDDGCQWVVTQSMWRLFLRDTCAQQWRGLTRESGLNWVAGDTVITNTGKDQFAFDEAGRTLTLTRQTLVGKSSSTVTLAKRNTPYRTETLSFKSADGTTLAGTLYVPMLTSGKASVMVHGSGPQDRQGYASIIAVMADELASNGEIVLSYDKRGVGQSGGDFTRQGFPQLAQDALTARDVLADRFKIRHAQIGLAGSSQAGWIVAQAITLVEASRERAIQRVFLLGAAGTALSVAEQNIYNTRVQMQCANIADSDIELALSQQRAFFDALANPSLSPALDCLTASARANTSIADWIFPGSEGLIQPQGNEQAAWYQTLATDFEPLEIWQRYPGFAQLVFSEFDDATPTAMVRARLNQLSNRKIRVTTLAGAQHLALNAPALCDSAIETRQHFHAGLFTALAAYASGK